MAQISTFWTPRLANSGESETCLATELKYFKDSSNDPGCPPHGATGATLDIKPARYTTASFELICTPQPVEIYHSSFAEPR